MLYFESTWIGSWNRRRTGRIPPRYAIQQWNCHHSVLEGLPKTNNSAEGFHHGFINLIGASHPTIFRLINGLKDQQSLTELKIQQFRV
jgi:cellulase/cellobiase CelA1